MANPLVKKVQELWDLKSPIVKAPVISGIDNSTWAITTGEGKFALTILENSTPTQIESTIPLLKTLVDKGFPVPLCVPSLQTSSQLPTYLVPHGEQVGFLTTWLEGEPVIAPNEAQCFSIGKLLAKMQQVTVEHPPIGPGVFEQCPELVIKALPKLSSEQVDAVKYGLDLWGQIDIESLKQGWSHSDLFCDNVLFTKNEVSGVIDFNSAGNCAQILDFATLILDFAYCPKSHRFLPNLVQALKSGYQEHACDQLVQELAILPHALNYAAVSVLVARVNREAEQTILPGNRTPLDMLQRIHQINITFNAT